MGNLPFQSFNAKNAAKFKVQRQSCNMYHFDFKVVILETSRLDIGQKMAGLACFCMSIFLSTISTPARTKAKEKQKPASMFGDTEVVSFLIKAGAHLDVR